MNDITQLDVLDLEHTIARYGVGTLIRYWPAVNGIENSNYFIRTLAERQGKQIDGIQPEALEALRGSDLIVHAGDIGHPEVLDRLAAWNG